MSRIILFFAGVIVGLLLAFPVWLKSDMRSSLLGSAYTLGYGRGALREVQGKHYRLSADEMVALSFEAWRADSARFFAVKP